MKKILCIFCIVFYGCVTTKFSDFYTPYIDSNTIPAENKLKRGEEPKIILSNDILNDGIDILTNHYSCIGSTSFNGPKENIVPDIKKQCLENGAKIALYQTEYTNTIYNEPGPKNYTGTTGYNGQATVADVFSAAGDLVGAMTAVDVKRYDYTVLYFVPLSESSPNIMLGFNSASLTNETKQKAGSNTGVYVTVVYKNTPAYYVNIMIGDVIIKINEYNIYDKDSMSQFIKTIKSGDKLAVTIIRDKVRNIIEYNIK